MYFERGDEREDERKDEREGWNNVQVGLKKKRKYIQVYLFIVFFGIYFAN